MASTSPAQQGIMAHGVSWREPVKRAFVEASSLRFAETLQADMLPKDESSLKQKSLDLLPSTKLPFTKPPQILLAGETGFMEDLRWALTQKGINGHKTAQRARVTLRHLLYFVNHRLDGSDLEALLPNIPKFTKQAKDAADTEMRAQQTIQHKVMTLFIWEKVKTIYSGNKAAEPSTDILDISKEERRILLQMEWSESPLSLCMAMWKPVARVIDWNVIFNPPAIASDAHKALMARWRDYLYACWFRAADWTIDIRLRALEKPDTLDLAEDSKPDAHVFKMWRGLSEADYMDVPTVEEVPVPPGYGLTFCATQN